MCGFDKSPTAAIVAFEGVVVAATAAALYAFRRVEPKIVQRYVTIAIGVLIFEVFTSPMWHNLHLGVWAYVYHDVSWILTLGWSTLILSTVVLIDRRFPAWSAGKRFAAYLVVLTAVVPLVEAVVVNLGIRSYSPEVRQTAVGTYVAGVPIEVLYYVPVFMALVIGFYKHWAFVIDDEPLLPVRKKRWGRTLGLTALAVVLFELMIEPMVTNARFPAWSYFYRDITFLMTGLWIVLIAVATNVVDKLFLHLDVRVRFLGYIGLIGIMALPLEAWFIHHGFRTYGPSATMEFIGFRTPVTDVPVEVAFAIPLYMALIVAFVRYWETLAENRR